MKNLVLRRISTGRPDTAALCIIALLFALNIYRAWTQSITHDEAHSYNIFIASSISHVFVDYQAGNHVLQSFLSKLSVQWFGLSEFTLRLPSLLGGLLYLVSAFRLSRFLFGGRWLTALSVAALCLNPLVLDFLSAARGYGLGLGFLLWALYHLMRYFDDSHQLRLYKAGLGFGLSVASTLIFLYPAAALIALVPAILAADGALSGTPGEARRRFWTAVDQFAGPALLTAFLILVIPLSRATREHFYYGADTLNEFVESLADSAFFHTVNLYAIAERVPGFEWRIPVLHRGLLPAVLLASAVLAVIAARKWLRLRRFSALECRERASILVAGAMVLLLAMMLVNHWTFGVRYLLSRTAIFWMPLFTLAVMLLIAVPRKPVSIPALVFAVGAIGMFLAGFSADSYGEWSYDRLTKDAVRIVRERNSAGREVRMGVSWGFEPSINFYRQRYRLDWLKPVDRDGPDRDFDFYYLMPTDAGLVQKRNLRPLLRDPQIGTVLAVKP
jgi:hypothetical protein